MTSNHHLTTQSQPSKSNYMATFKLRLPPLPKHPPTKTTTTKLPTNTPTRSFHNTTNTPQLRDATWYYFVSPTHTTNHPPRYYLVLPPHHHQYYPVLPQNPTNPPKLLASKSQLNGPRIASNPKDDKDVVQPKRINPRAI